MRRKECMEWPPCLPPRVQGVRNKQDYGHRKPYIYYQLRSQLIMSEGHDVLNIDIFNGYRLEARYFADCKTGSHVALILKTGEWKKLILANVVNACAGMSTNYQNYGWGYSEYEAFEYASQEDKERVRQWAVDANSYSLESWESELQSKRRYRQLQNKKDRINDMLRSMIPDIPQDFYRWMHEEIFGRKYLFQHKDKDTGDVIHICNACMKRWRQKKATGRGRKTCQKCNAQVTGTYREKETAEETLFLLQPCELEGYWTERVLKAKCTYTPLQETFVEMFETIRYIIKNGECWGESIYYLDDIDPDGKPVYWETNHHSYRPGEGYLYPGSLRDCLECWPEGLRNAGMHILAISRVKANYNNIVTVWHCEPWFEYLVKGGFFALIRETAAGMYTDGRKTSRLNDRGRNMQEVFRINPQRIDRLRQAGGGFKMLNWLQYEEVLGQKITPENMKFLSNHFWPDESNVWKVLGYVRSANVFANYVRRQAGEIKTSPATILGEWCDYLDMAEKQGLNLSHEMFYKPKNLKEAHDACVREAQMAEGRKRAKEILKKFPDVEKNLDMIRDKYTYKGQDYCILVPDGIPDIIHEGRALGHCIDSTDRYFDRINQDISYLVFLRRTSAPTVPWYTLEIEPGGTIRQQRTTGNNQNKEDVKEYTPFIREWQGVVRQRMSQADKDQAEHSKAVRMQEYQDLREKKEKVWHGKLAGKLLADVLEADLIENVI